MHAPQTGWVGAAAPFLIWLMRLYAKTLLPVAVALSLSPLRKTMENKYCPPYLNKQIKHFVGGGNCGAHNGCAVGHSLAAHVDDDDNCALRLQRRDKIP